MQPSGHFIGLHLALGAIEFETSGLIKRLLCRLHFTQYKNMWLVKIRRLVGSSGAYADLWEYVFIVQV